MDPTIPTWLLSATFRDVAEWLSALPQEEVFTTVEHTPTGMTLGKI